jgi:hypothetical protein
MLIKSQTSISRARGKGREAKIAKTMKKVLTYWSGKCIMFSTMGSRARRQVRLPLTRQSNDQFSAPRERIAARVGSGDV